MTIESSLDQSKAGTKSYRGRTLDEILPQIRDELGPDAVIVREREGLVGGVGGFFAQRFVEVEARRGDGQSIDVYDEPDEEALEAPAPRSVSPRTGAGSGSVSPRTGAGPGSGSGSGSGSAASSAPEPRLFVPPSISVVREEASAPQPDRERAPEPQAAPMPEAEAESEASVPPPPPRGRQRNFETSVFMDRLREAQALPVDQGPRHNGVPAPLEPEPPAAASAASPHVEASASAREAALPELNAAVPELEASDPAPAEREFAGPAPATADADPLDGLAADIDAGEAIAALRQIRPAARPQRTAPPRPTSRPQSRTSQSRPSPRPAPQPAKPTPAEADAPASPSPAARPELRPAAPPRRPPGPRPAARPTSRSAQRPAQRPTPKPALPAPQRPARPAEHPIREAIAGLLGRRQPSVAKPSPAQPLDAAAAARLTQDLAGRGASRAWIDELVGVAGAHGVPLAGGLRAAAQAEIARRVVVAPPLPAMGAAIAFVGAGGSGKTRCTAAMASAYRLSSTLAVTVIALESPDGGSQLRKLLEQEAVPVLALSGEEAKRAVELGRQDGLVIIDTPTATPTEPGAIEALGAKLAPLGLDATYVALPATVAPHVARSSLTSFGKLNPAAITITHTDETDQLAGLVEVAVTHRIPMAFFHSGTDHRRALSAVDPRAIAEELLP